MTASLTTLEIQSPQITHILSSVSICIANLTVTFHSAFVYFSRQMFINNSMLSPVFLYPPQITKKKSTFFFSLLSTILDFFSFYILLFLSSFVQLYFNTASPLTTVFWRHQCFVYLLLSAHTSQNLYTHTVSAPYKSKLSTNDVYNVFLCFSLRNLYITRGKTICKNTSLCDLIPHFCYFQIAFPLIFTFRPNSPITMHCVSCFHVQAYSFYKPNFPYSSTKLFVIYFMFCRSTLSTARYLQMRSLMFKWLLPTLASCTSVVAIITDGLCISSVYNPLSIPRFRRQVATQFNKFLDQ